MVTNEDMMSQGELYSLLCREILKYVFTFQQQQNKVHFYVAGMNQQRKKLMTRERGDNKSNKVLDTTTVKGIQTTHGWTSHWEKLSYFIVWDRKEEDARCHGNWWGDSPLMTCVFLWSERRGYQRKSLRGHGGGKTMKSKWAYLRIAGLFSVSVWGLW